MANVPWVALPSTRCHYRCGCVAAIERLVGKLTGHNTNVHEQVHVDEVHAHLYAHQTATLGARPSCPRLASLTARASSQPGLGWFVPFGQSNPHSSSAPPPLRKTTCADFYSEIKAHNGLSLYRALHAMPHPFSTFAVSQPHWHAIYTSLLGTRGTDLQPNTPPSYHAAAHDGRNGLLSRIASALKAILCSGGN